MLDWSDPENIRERVDRGVAELEKNDPLWYRDINVCDLRMHRCYDCVLGQKFGDYHVGLSELQLPDVGWKYGFDAVSGSDEEYDALQFEWVSIIESYDTDATK